MILHMLSSLSMFVVMVNDTCCYLIYFKFMLVQVKQSRVSFNFKLDILILLAILLKEYV